MRRPPRPERVANLLGEVRFQACWDVGAAALVTSQDGERQYRVLIVVVPETTETRGHIATSCQCPDRYPPCIHVDAVKIAWAGELRAKEGAPEGARS